MNSLHIIGNVTADAQLRTTQAGISVCSFTVAVNPKFSKENAKEKEAQFFKVTAWRKLGENCGKYVVKGMKVSVVGAVELQTYTNDKGETRSSMAVTADDVEFLTRADSNNAERQGNNNQPSQSNVSVPQQSQNFSNGFTEVDMGDNELPF